MRAITYFAVLMTGLATIACNAKAEIPEGWMTEVQPAIEQAKKEGKLVMLEFTGSDWCPPCIMMKKEVFSKDEFLEGASESYVLVHLDFPQGDEAVYKKNEKYLETYKIEGFPTVVLLDAEGDEFSRFYASEFPKVDLFLARLEEGKANRELD